MQCNCETLFFHLSLARVQQVTLNLPTPQSGTCSNFNLILTMIMLEPAHLSFVSFTFFAVSARGVIPITQFCSWRTLQHNQLFWWMAVARVHIPIIFSVRHKLRKPSLARSQFDLPFRSSLQTVVTYLFECIDRRWVFHVISFDTFQPWHISRSRHWKQISLLFSLNTSPEQIAAPLAALILRKHPWRELNNRHEKSDEPNNTFTC